MFNEIFNSLFKQCGLPDNLTMKILKKIIIIIIPLSDWQTHHKIAKIAKRIAMKFWTKKGYSNISGQGI